VSAARALWARDRFGALLAAIAAVTIVSGLFQLVFPGFVLDLLDAESSKTTRHFFAIVGMFMAIVGGLLLHTLLLPPPPDRVVVLWAAIQKAGAFAAVSLGVFRDVFSELAFGVALFDLATAVLLAWYLRRLPR
jgi:hypothetical protein